MSAPPSLQVLVDYAVFMSTEHQAHLADLHDGDSWQVDLDAAQLTLTSASGSVKQMGAQLLGSAAPGPRSWMWAWNNINGFPDVTTQAARVVRDAGAPPELATAELPLTDELPYRLALAAKAINRSWTHYSLPVGGGTRVWLLVDHPTLALPAPTVPRVLRSIAEGLGSTTVERHRFAVEAYADLRGMALTDEGGVLHVAASDGVVKVELDGAGRITNLVGSANGATPGRVTIGGPTPGAPTPGAPTPGAPAPSPAQQAAEAEPERRRGWFSRRG